MMPNDEQPASPFARSVLRGMEAARTATKNRADIIALLNSVGEGLEQGTGLIVHLAGLKPPTIGSVIVDKLFTNEPVKDQLHDFDWLLPAENNSSLTIDLVAYVGECTAPADSRTICRLKIDPTGFPVEVEGTGFEFGREQCLDLESLNQTLTQVLEAPSVGRKIMALQRAANSEEDRASHTGLPSADDET